MPNRDDAWKLLCEYTASESLRKHALAVEACVRAYARKNGADEELWGNTALLHDFDYERWPNAEHHPTQEHPYEGSKILREQGLSGRDDPSDPRPRRLFQRAARVSTRSHAVRLRRAGWIFDGLRAGETEQENCGSGNGFGEEKIEGQGICARGESAGCLQGGGGIGRAARGAYFVLY